MNIATEPAAKGSGATRIVSEKRVLIDLDRCIECQSCAAACFHTHGDMPVVHFARAGWAILPVLCRQCKAAACVEACPKEAMVRDEHGVVRRHLALCIGCGSCARACPFGVIPLAGAGTPVAAVSTDRMSGFVIAKCDLCVDRTAAGSESGSDNESGNGAVPRCVAACPTGALLFADERLARELELQTLGGRTTGGHPFKRR